MKHWLLGILALGLVGLVFAAGAPVPYERAVKPILLTGVEDTPYEHTPPPPLGPAPRRSLDDPISDTYVMGTTWYDNQHNGTFGKQIAVDREGYVHCVWTNGLNSSSSIRHCFYNVWSPVDQGFLLPDPGTPTGSQIDGFNRGGFVNVVVNRLGFAFPAYHHVVNAGENPHAVAAIDYAPRFGAFTPSEIPRLAGEPQIIWPHAAIDTGGNLHLVCTESGGAGAEYYARGVPVFDDDGYGLRIDWPIGFEAWDPASFVTIDVAASFRSRKIAVAWLYDPPGSWLRQDVWVKISNDGGLTWEEPINVTNFPPVDTNCVRNGGNRITCNGDTLQPWIDLSVLIDHNDVVHVAFSCWGWYYWMNIGGVDSVGPWILTARPSNIWHWDEVRREYNIVAERWFGINGALGSNQLMCHRPSLAVDTVTGYLYCSFQMYDTTQWSDHGHLQADAYVTVSCDGGRTWAVATNVSRTDGGQDTPAPGCMVERDINIARTVTNGIVHMQYMLDHHAGTSAFTTDPMAGVPTLNEMIYQPIPVELIPTRPLINPYRNLRVDSTGYPWDLDTTSAVSEPNVLRPGEIALHQNYPNPFNAATRIQFDLTVGGRVNLRVYDVLGREAAVLLNSERLEAGVHVVDFRADELPSGVYFYRLETPQAQQTRKMVLMR